MVTWGHGKGMLKLSITLPNGALITLESDSSEPVHEVLSQVLGRMQMDGARLGELYAASTVDAESVTEKGSGVPEYVSVRGAEVSGDSTNVLVPPNGRGVSGPSGYPNSGNGANGAGHGESGDSTLDLNRYPSQAKQDFVAFCEAINPTGDMRRVVVATEAANRFFGLEGVTADEAGELFDLIGWRRANNFTQTVRNAARSKFGWLERIPGRSGRYAATDLGRSTTLSG